MNKIFYKMFTKMQKNMVEAFNECLNEMINSVINGTLDPNKLSDILKKMGADSSQLSGIFGSVQGFDPYRVLGLNKSATNDEIKKRYNDLVHKLHPDTAGTQGTDFLFQIVMMSYEMIKKERGL
jgi:DnaJ-domain-containing protein 1